MKKVLLILIVLVILLIAVALVLFWKYADNSTLVTTHYNITNEKIPAGFEGYRILQVADLHNTLFGQENEQLLSLIAENEPDIIVFTGDQVDARRKNLDIVIDFIEEALKIAPCYLVTGNHEGSIVETSQLLLTLEQMGVNVLRNEIVPLQEGNDSLQLIGVDDPTMGGRFLEIDQEPAMDEVLTTLEKDSSLYSILLSHHPEYLETYAKHNMDLVLCGHAHGGQVRIGNQGIIAPHQGMFPKYDAGLYTMDNTTMILSRGLGNSLFPWRINNPPELVVVELHNA